MWDEREKAGTISFKCRKFSFLLQHVCMYQNVQIVCNIYFIETICRKENLKIIFLFWIQQIFSGNFPFILEGRVNVRGKDNYCGLKLKGSTFDPQIHTDSEVKGQPSSPAISLLRFGQRVVKERISFIEVFLLLQVQVQALPLVGRDLLLLEISFTQRAFWVLSSDMTSSDHTVHTRLEVSRWWRCGEEEDVEAD